MIDEAHVALAAGPARWTLLLAADGWKSLANLSPRGLAAASLPVAVAALLREPAVESPPRSRRASAKSPSVSVHPSEATSSILSSLEVASAFVPR